MEGRIKRSETFKREFSRNIEGVHDFIDVARGVDELKELSEERQVRSFKKKDTIYYEGDHPNVLFFLNKGAVKTYKIHDDGKEYITGLVKSGEFFGYMPIIEDRAYSDFAVAMEPCEVYRIPKADFVALLGRNRDVANRFIKMISNDLTDKEELLLSLAYDSVRKRVANALLKLADGNQKGMENSSDIDISRNDLASMVGTASESVIRTLADFKEENLITVAGKIIKIIDEQGLKNIW